jgi:hypothetical protein
VSTESLREHLVRLLAGEGAHARPADVIPGLPYGHAGAKVPGTRNTAWRLLEHLRIAQWDILEFSRNPGHVSPDFPDGYWPADDVPADEAEWQRTIDGFLADLEAMQALVRDPATDLFAPIPHGDGQTILREALLVADHNAYHLGQLVSIAKSVGAL